MGEPKVSVLLPNGETMGERAAALLGEVCEEVVLLGSCEGLPPRLGELPAISDRWEECGPLGGIEALLASGRDTEYLVLPCDLPLLSASLLLLLAGSAAPALFRLKGEARPEPFPALIPASVHRRLAEDLTAGRLSARAFLEGLSPHLVDVPAGEEPCFRNVNTPDEIRDPLLAERLARKKGKARR
jgi:molybdopterin-guanine dinucleotide biosynthesis protein A